MTSTAPHTKLLEQAIVPDPIIVSPNTPLAEVVWLMSQAQENGILHKSSASSSHLAEARSGCVLVVSQGTLLGLFTLTDMIRVAASGRQPGSLSVAQVITRQPVSLERSQLHNPILALKYLKHHRLSHLPIVDEQQQVVGLVTAATLCKGMEPTDLLKPHQVAAMMTKEVVQASVDTLMITVATLMAERQSDYVVVTTNEENGSSDMPIYPIGMIREHDILKTQAMGLNLATLTAGSVMKTPLACLSVQDSLWTAHQKMHRHHEKRMVVIGSHGGLAGLITQETLTQLMEPGEMQTLLESLQQRIAELEHHQSVLEHQHQHDVAELSQQKSTLKVLQQTQSHYHQLLESATMGIWVFDRNQQTNFVNQYVLDRLGYNREDMLGQSLSNFVEGDDQITLPTSEPFEKRGLHHATLNGHRHPQDNHEHPVQEMRLRHKDGSYRWMLTSTTSLHNGSHEYVGVLTTLTDMGNANSLEGTLEKLFSKTADTIGLEFLERLVQCLVGELGVAAAGISQIVGDRLQSLAVYAQGTLQPILNYPLSQTPEELTLTQGSYYCATELANHYPQFDLGLPFKPESYLGVSLKTADEELIGTLFLLDTTPIGTARSFLKLLQTLTVRIITEIERQTEREAFHHTNQLLEAELAQQRLIVQDSEERFRKMADSVPVFLWMSGKDNLHYFFNRTWLAFTGTDLVDQIGYSWADNIHPEDSQAYLNAYLAAFNAQKPLTTEYRLKHTNGDYRWILDISTPRKGPDGSSMGYIGAGIDITDYKQAILDTEEALIQQSQLFKQRSRAITKNFQRFKTPIKLIKNAVTTLAKKQAAMSDGQKLRYLAQIQISAKHLGEILEDGLVINQTEDGELQFNPTRTNLIQFCRDLVAGVERDHPSYQFRFTLQRENHHQDSKECKLIDVLIDTDLLRQIAHHLLSNAIKFSKPGSTVHICLIERSSAVGFQIQDEGIGIPPDLRDKLFHAFRRAKNVGDIPGEGLGLMIVKRCLDVNGGDIMISSELDAGTTFTVMMPVQYMTDESSAGQRNSQY